MWGYSMLEQETFISDLGVEREAARRMLRRSSPTKATEGVLERAAEVSGFPKAFALEGIDAEQPAVVERLEAVERRVETFFEALRRTHEGTDLGDALVAIYEEHTTTESADSPAQSDEQGAPTSEQEADRHGRAAPAGAQS